MDEFVSKSRCTLPGREALVWFVLVYLFNVISTPNGLFNAGIWLICKHLLVITTTYILLGPFVCSLLYNIKYSYLIKIIYIKVHSSKYSGLKLSILWNIHHLSARGYMILRTLCITSIFNQKYFTRRGDPTWCWVKVDLGVKATKFPRAPKLKPHSRMLYKFIFKIRR